MGRPLAARLRTVHGVILVTEEVADAVQADGKRPSLKKSADKPRR